MKTESIIIILPESLLIKKMQNGAIQCNAQSCAQMKKKAMYNKFDEAERHNVVNRIQTISRKQSLEKFLGHSIFTQNECSWSPKR
jgi:hypothetical protein